MLELLNKYKKQIVYVIVGLVLLYGIIWITTRKSQIPADLKASIDSLTVVNKKLMKSYKNEWKERTFQTKQFKKYWHYRQGQQGFAGPSKDGAFLRNEPEFLDD